MRGVDGGFTQANHGKPHMLKKMKKGDGIIFYSPKTAFEGGLTLQAFTALGIIDDEEPYKFEMNSTFEPWRRRVNFEKSVDAPIKPLIASLDFIEDKQHWGYKFRFGVLSISEKDFETIARAMKAPSKSSLF